MTLRYGSVCSGIEAASVAWEPLGWKPVFFSEVDPFCCYLLAHHYGSNLPSKPLAINGVPNFGDINNYKDWPNATINVLVGGTPCQSFSIAGLRQGLDDPRGNLTLTYLAVVERYRPEWVVWENVPGVLSVDGGRAFSAFLTGLAKCGYGWAYRVLDAQYVRVDGHPRAVPQRRRRVFVVGHSSGDFRRAAEILFEPEGLRGDSPPSREAGKDVAGTFKARANSGGWSQDVDLAAGGYMQVVGTLGARTCRSIGAQDADCGHIIPVAMATGQGGAETAQGLCPSLTCNHEAPIVTYGIPGNWIGRKPENGGNAVEPMHDVAPCLTKADVHGVAHPIPYGVGALPDAAHCLRSGASKADKHESTTYVVQQMAVRRLTPIECERLQGFHDGYSLTTRRNGKPATDGPRYKALGNSMACNVMRWIGQRIQIAHEASQ